MWYYYLMTTTPGVPDPVSGLFPRFTKRQWRAGTLLFVCYVAAVRVTSVFFSAPGLIFPAAGIAVGGLFLEGYALWPFVLLASATGYVLNGSSLVYILLMPFVHLLQAIVAVYLLRRLKLDPLFRRPEDAFGMVLVALVASAIVPTLGTLVRHLNSYVYDTPLTAVTWVSWYAAIVFSLLIVTPFVIRWFAKPHFSRTLTQWTEITVVLGFLSILTYLIFWTETGSVYGISLVYFLLVPLFWTALRLTPRFMTLALVMMSFVAFAGLFFGPAVAGETLGIRLFETEIFLIIMAFIFLILVVLEEQRRIALKLIGTQVETLRAARDQLTSETRAKSEFIAVIAHELRNPLAPIESSLDVLKATLGSDEKHAQTLDMMRERMQVVKRLLDDMMDMSRVAKNKLSIEKKTVDLGAVVRSAAGAAAGKLAEHGQTLSITTPDTPIYAEADAVRLEQVITNLLTNASKFSNEGGRVAVSVRANGMTGEITVKDDGIGIEASMLANIFDPFRQIEHGERTKKGIGIGLALVRSIVEMHGGTVSVESEGRGRGSEFTLCLPLTHATITESAIEAPKKGQKKPDRALSVLIVDDNDAAAWGIGKLLELSGCAVDFAYDGCHAIERVAATRPDAVLLDIGLPDMDGYMVAKEMRKQGYAGTLIALTGYGLEEDITRSREVGFDDFLVKPIGLAELKRALPFAA